MPIDGLQGLAPVAPLPPVGSIPNEKHQITPGFLQGAPYQLAFVELDDQGRCYDRTQMDKVAEKLGVLEAQSQDAIIVAFVHGWKHDARTNDDNLTAFRELLTKVVRFEQSQGQQARPVMGVFVGWRGMSKYGVGDTIADVTFWDRQAAGARVATGSVRELFGRLRGYRNRRRDAKGAPLLVIAGHSFGGMIVYSALEQALIDAAATPAGEIVSGFADLVLLVNPAIAGTRYLPVYDIVSSDDFKNGRAPQLPIFVCTQAENDQPVGVWFPLGNAADHKPDQVKGALEEKCVSHALGFVKEFRTHEVSGPNGGDDFSLDPPEIEGQNPFWVIGAAQAVIDGHGGIWQEPFEEMLKAIVFTHVLASTGTHRLAASRATHAQDGRLATLARSLKVTSPLTATDCEHLPN